MLYQNITIGDLDIVIELMSTNQFKVYKINTFTDGSLTACFVDGQQLYEGQILSFDNTYDIKTIEWLNQNSENSIGIFYHLSKKDSIHIDDKKYYDLEIDTKSAQKIKLTDGRIHTTVFNQVPLFYKFSIEQRTIDFENDEFSITDLDGRVIPNYVVNTYDDYHTVFIDATANNKYFYTHNKETFEAYTINTNEARLFSKAFNGTSLKFSRAKYIDSFALNHSDMSKDYSIKITFESGDYEFYKIQQINNYPTHATKDFIRIRDFVTRVDLISDEDPKHSFHNSNKTFLWFNEVWVEEINGDLFYRKNSNIDLLFTAIEYKDLKREDITADLSEMKYGKNYILDDTTNSLIENEQGNITNRDFSKQNILLLNYIDYPEDTPYQEYLEYMSEDIDEELKTYYNENFKSVDTVLTYEGDV